MPYGPNDVPNRLACRDRAPRRGVAFRGNVRLRLIRNFATKAGRDMRVELDLAFQLGGNRGALNESTPLAALKVEKWSLAAKRLVDAQMC
jgi:hypothetical protein